MEAIIRVEHRHGQSSRQFKVISKMLEGGQIEIYADRQ